MSFARNIATVGSATLFSRALGFLRDVGIASILGAGPLSDAYFAALQIPNLFRRLLAEGALNSAFVPMWMRIEDESGRRAARRFAEEVLGTMLLALGTLAALCIVFAPEVVRLMAPGFSPGGGRYQLAAVFVVLSAPYIAFASIVAFASSVLNAKGRVGAVALGIVVFNFVFLFAVGVVLFLDTGATAVSGEILSTAVAVAGVGQLLVVGGALLRLPERPLVPRLAISPQARRFFVLVVPGVIAGGIPQLKLMVGAMVASSSQAGVSWLYYANRLYELPLGVVSIAIAAVMVPLIASSVREREPEAIGSAQSRAFEIALGLALPSAVAFALLAERIAGGLFQHGEFGPRDTAAVAAALAAICAGLPGHVLEKVLGAVSFAHEDTRTPMFTALAGLAIATILAFALFPTYGHVGVAAAIAISGWVGAILLGIILSQRRWLRFDREARRRLPLIAMATVIMGAAIYFAQKFLASTWDISGSAPARIGSLVALVALGLTTYGIILHLTKTLRLSELLASFRRI